MVYNPNDPLEENIEYSPRNPGIAMSMAALFLGIASIFTVASVLLPFILGGISILLAILSKGYGKKMLVQAKIGIGCAIGGMIITVFVITSSVTALLKNPDMLLQFGKQYDQMFEDMYGESTEEVYGSSFEDIMKQYADMLSSSN